MLYYFSNAQSFSTPKLWNVYTQKASQDSYWMNYSGPLCIKDSTLFTTLLSEGYISKIDLRNKSVINNFCLASTINIDQDAQLTPGDLINFNDGFLVSYFIAIYKMQANGKDLFFKANDLGTIEKIFVTKSNQIVLFFNSSSDFKSYLYLLSEYGVILDKIAFDPFELYGLFYSENELSSTKYNISIENKQKIIIKEKNVLDQIKPDEFPIGIFKDRFILYNKNRPSTLIVRDKKTLKILGNIQMPLEMTHQIKSSISFNDPENSHPVLDIVTCGDCFYINFVSNKRFYIYVCNETTSI